MQSRYRHFEQFSWVAYPCASPVFHSHRTKFLTAPLGPECVELADAQMMHAINISASTSSRESKSPGPYAAVDSLFLKLQGTPQSIAETSKVIRDILSTHGCGPQHSFKLALGEDEAREMWDHRRGALYASMKMVEGGRVWSTDVWFVFCP
jgi:D-lactate dehydrogenase (cytochrome)